MAENYKHLYEQMKKMVAMYQDEIVPGMREQLEKRVEVVRCKDCKHRNKKKCPLVMVRLDVKTNGTIKEVLEQNYVDEDFWCKDGKRKDG